MSRGTMYSLSASVRKGFVLFWTALLLATLLSQYVAIVAPAKTLAVHNEGLFELDGNTVNDPSVAGDDWDSHPGATGNHSIFITDPLSNTADDTFTGGSTKDGIDIPSWQWVVGSAPAKDNIEHAYAVNYQKNGDTFVYFGLDRYANNGDSFTGFWFTKTPIAPTAGGGFSGKHSVGDLLVLSNFTNGGATSSIYLYKWVGSGGTDGALDLLASGQNCTGSPASDMACAVTNQTLITPSWSFTDKFGAAGIPPESFFEGGINLGALFGQNVPCYSGFFAETRSSQSLTAVLEDFAGGAFNTCTPPDITTTSSTAAPDFGTKVHDTATLSGTFGPASGSVDFYLCGPTLGSNPDCTTGGTKIGTSPVTTSANGGTAVSPDYTVGTTKAATGSYCWRAVYNPDANSQYLTGSHTNTSTECFTVAPATIAISKTAVPAGPVNAGDTIGFDIKVTNTGTQTTYGVAMSDPLPAGMTWSVGTPTTSGTVNNLSCGQSSGTLSCSADSMAAGAFFTVHVQTTTAAANCGTVSNTAHVGTANDGSADATASVVVNCPGLTLTKKADSPSVNAGDQIGFTIVLGNNGPGTAYNVTLSDPLPAGVTWALAAPVTGCAITGTSPQTLACSFATLAAGGKVTLHVVAPTTSASCATYTNTATATVGNGAAPAPASDSVVVNCPVLTITKTADASPVNAGDAIGFKVIVTNTGAGTAYNVAVNDPLPAGVTWTLNPAVTGCAITGTSSQTLACSFATLASQGSVTLHVTGTTSPAVCGTVTNTATASLSNGTNPDPATASVVVNCPNLTITKTANPQGPVNAGDPIGFDVTVANSGQGTAYNVAVNDPLPAGVTWTLAPAVTGCSITGNTGSQVLGCSFASLAGNGASVILHVTAPTTAESCATYTNTATASLTNGTSPAPATASVVVICPDITVTKSADKGTISAGDNAGFTMVVTNLGPGTAKNVTLDDPLPNTAAVNWSTTTTNCQVVAGHLTCSWAELANGASVSVHVTGETTAAACGVLNNLVTVAATNEPKANQDNNTASASVTVQCPPVSITKTADAASVSAGDQIGFTITVSNNTAFTALNVVVDDPLPTNGGLGWTISGADNGFSIVNGHLVHAATSLASNSTLSVHIVSGTTAATCGTVNNTATVTYNSGPEGGLSDSSQVLVNCPDVTITKTAANSPILAGQVATFTLTASNAGPGTAKGVTITDDLSKAPLSGITWSVDNQSCAISAGILTCNVGTLAPGAKFSVTLTGPTAAANCGVLPNTASVAATNEPASSTDNNQASASITVQCASISLVKTAGSAADGTQLVLAQPGNVTFTYVVTNTGTATLQNLVLVDDNATPADKSDDFTVTCPKSTLAPGESMTCTATRPVTYGTWVNTATVTGHPSLSPEGTVSATDDASVMVPQPEVTPTPTPTPTPKITLPPTSTLDTNVPSGQSGSGLLLVLAAVGFLMLMVGLLAPAPARARRRTRKS